MAALEAKRGNTKDALEAREQARRRLQVLDPSQVKDPSEQERLMHVRAAVEETATSSP
jgi:hypothetical protein